MKIYLAPMEGITDYIFRRTFMRYFDGVDTYFTPFLSPNSNFNLTTKEKDEIDVEKNKGVNLVPQLLTNNSEHFLYYVKEIKERGYEEININLGCPSGTVTAKKKGSGLLFYTELLERFLDEVYEGCEKENIKLSIKTRLGYKKPEEFEEILEIYNRFPVKELTVHPRIRDDFYKEPVRLEWFDFAYKNAKAPICYNGEIKTKADLEKVMTTYQNLSAIMIGRGLIANPFMLMEEDNKAKIMREFSNDLLVQYEERLSGDLPVLARMKEFWNYFIKLYTNYDEYEKKLRKTKTVSEFKLITNQIFENETIL